MNPEMIDDLGPVVIDHALVMDHGDRYLVLPGVPDVQFVAATVQERGWDEAVEDYVHDEPPEVRARLEAALARARASAESLADFGRLFAEPIQRRRRTVRGCGSRRAPRRRPTRVAARRPARADADDGPPPPSAPSLDRGAA